MRFNQFLLLFMLAFLVSCSPKEEAAKASKNKTMDGEVISAPIVSKPFVNKVGKASDFEEYYIQRSVQDYFIKFCESNVTKEELEKKLDEQGSSLIKSLTMEVEFREGEWDQCDEDYQVQSRIGKYVVILKIK